MVHSNLRRNAQQYFERGKSPICATHLWHYNVQLINSHNLLHALKDVKNECYYCKTKVTLRKINNIVLNAKK